MKGLTFLSHFVHSYLFKRATLFKEFSIVFHDLVKVNEKDQNELISQITGTNSRDWKIKMKETYFALLAALSPIIIVG